jgi:hypothetical protein
VLASREIEIPMTHDLGYLVTLVEALPSGVAESRWLTPWSGGWRYDAEASLLEREKALRVAQCAVEWADVVVKKTAGGE